MLWWGGGINKFPIFQKKLQIFSGVRGGGGSRKLWTFPTFWDILFFMALLNDCFIKEVTVENYTEEDIVAAFNADCTVLGNYSHKILAVSSADASADMFEDVFADIIDQSFTKLSFSYNFILIGSWDSLILNCSGHPLTRKSLFRPSLTWHRMFWQPLMLTALSWVIIHINCGYFVCRLVWRRFCIYHWPKNCQAHLQLQLSFLK